MVKRSRATTNHDEIRSFVESRGGHPACVRRTGGKGDVGLLRFDFPGYSGSQLEEITWDDFFQKFDEKRLAVVMQEETAAGRKSNFIKLVNRDSVDLDEEIGGVSKD